MAKSKKSGKDLSKISYRVVPITEEILTAAVYGPYPGHYLDKSEVIREAVFEWGVTHEVRDAQGGLRLLNKDLVVCPFGKDRVLEILKSSGTNTKDNPPTSVKLPRLCSEIIKTATEDPSAPIKLTASFVISVALVQWGLTHLNITAADGQVDFVHPMSLRNAFDIDPELVPLSLASIAPISADAHFFDVRENEDKFVKGSVSVPYYRVCAEPCLGTPTRATGSATTQVTTPATAVNSLKNTSTTEEDEVTSIINSIDWD